MANPYQRLLTDGQRLLSDAQRLFSDSSFENNLFAQPYANAGASISQIMGDIGLPKKLTGFPATNILETPEYYELQSEVPGVDKKSLKIEVSDSHTLNILGKVTEIAPVKNDNNMEEDAPTSEAIKDTPQEAESQENQSASVKPEAGKEKKDIRQVQTPAWWSNERVLGSYGSFRRSIFFLDPIDVYGAKATIRNGLLEIIVPKAKDSRTNINVIELQD